MTEAKLFCKKDNNSVIWILKIEGKVTKNRAYSKEDLLAIFDLIKFYGDKILLKTNFKFFQKNNPYKDKIKVEVVDIKENNETKKTIEDIKTLNPDLPDFMNKRIEELIHKDEPLFHTKINTYLFKAFLYFTNSNTTIVDFPLFVSLKDIGYFEQDILLEDIFATFEEVLSN